MAWNTKYQNEVRAQYNFESNLFRQIERINISDTLERKIQNIEILEVMLQPYIDDDYEENLEDLKTENRKKLEESKDKYGRIREKKFNTYRFITALLKYKALMNLLFRKDFLPQYAVKKKTVGGKK